MRASFVRQLAQFVFVVLCVAVSAACNRIRQPQWCPPTPCDPVLDFSAEKTNWGAFESPQFDQTRYYAGSQYRLHADLYDHDVTPSPPPRTSRLVLSDGTPVTMTEPLQTCRVPESWLPLLTCATSKGHTVAKYVRFMRDRVAGVTEIRVYETANHRDPFVTLPCAEYPDEFATLASLIGENAVSASVYRDSDGDTLRYYMTLNTR